MAMKPMGNSGKGIQLTTGEVIGRWSMDDNDGRREKVSGGQNPGSVKLPSSSDSAPTTAGAAGADGEADSFADR